MSGYEINARGAARGKNVPHIELYHPVLPAHRGIRVKVSPAILAHGMWRSKPPLSTKRDEGQARSDASEAPENEQGDVGSINPLSMRGRLRRKSQRMRASRVELVLYCDSDVSAMLR